MHDDFGCWMRPNGYIDLHRKNKRKGGISEVPRRDNGEPTVEFRHQYGPPVSLLIIIDHQPPLFKAAVNEPQHHLAVVKETQNSELQKRSNKRFEP